MTLMSGYATTATAPAKARGGCGCGGGGGCSGGCSGGSGGGSAARALASAYVRPQFFSGMLLTEDDLQAVTEYVIGKRRLTNRYVFGPGVVCGLDVSCDPCATGSVVVGPGYGIDCCGNDVVVDCPAQVDVVALVRELRQRSGVDCGEPCGDRPCHDYVLNVIYAEEASDPVAPYAEDDCAVGDCEFSRVREGFRFELSYDALEPEPSIIDVIKACVNLDDERVKEDAIAMTRVARLGMSRAPEHVRGDSAEPVAAKPDIPLRTEFEQLDRDDAEFLASLKLLTRATVALAQDAAAQAGRGPSLGLTQQRRNLVSSRTRSIARRLLASDRLAAMPDAEREGVIRILNIADTQRSLADVSEREQLQFIERVDEGSAEEVYRQDALRLKSRVLRQLVDSGRAGCQEYRAVAALRFATLDENSPREVSVLGRTFVSVLVGCVCAAANPLCPSCTDTRIPLARVRVEGCDVVSVCDLERRWVHSPRALAYWFPVVEVLRELLDKRCCDDDCDPGEGKPVQLKGRTRTREAAVLRTQAKNALRMVRPPEDVPVIREVLEALGDQFIDSPAARQQPPPVQPPPAAEDPRVAVLEKQVAELSKRLEDLAGRIP